MTCQREELFYKKERCSSTMAMGAALNQMATIADMIKP